MAQLDQTTINRYQPGGDVYTEIVSQYGTSAANKIAAAAKTGDGAALANAIALARGDGPALDDSTLDAFGNLLATDPLGAPLDWLEKLLGKTAADFLKNPWVLLTIALVLFFLFGGADLIRSWVRRKAK